MTDETANAKLTRARADLADATFATFALQHEQGTFMQFLEGIRADAYNAGYAIGLHEAEVVAAERARADRA